MLVFDSVCVYEVFFVRLLQPEQHVVKWRDPLELLEETRHTEGSNYYNFVCVCVSVCVFLYMWGLKPESSLMVWGPTIFVGTKSWTPQL